MFCLLTCLRIVLLVGWKECFDLFVSGLFGFLVGFVLDIILFDTVVLLIAYCIGWLGVGYLDLMFVYVLWFTLR